MSLLHHALRAGLAAALMVAFARGVETQFWVNNSRGDYEKATLKRLALGYVFGFRHGKPPGYDIDLLDYWLCGAAIAPPENRATKNLIHTLVENSYVAN